MHEDDPNLPHLRHIARALGELREHVVFVGAAVAGLLVTDPLADGVRATRDVDGVVRGDWIAFRRIEEQLTKSGFVPDARSDVICRWVHKASGLLFDLMPVEADVLGFSNRWYPYAVETAQRRDLGEGVIVRLASAVAFVATKLEAFADRGGGDFLSSHDLEDVMSIVAGRAELVDEMAMAPAELRQAVAAAFARLLAQPDFTNVLPGLLAEPERTGVLLQRLKRMCA